MRAIALLLVGVLGGTVRAEPAAPPADQASGVEIAEEPPASDHLLWIPRVVLFVPRWALWVVAQPIRGGAYVYERYNLNGRLKRAFFNTDGTFGIYPIANYESGFGITGGGRLVHKDLFGQGERMRLRLDYGGRFRLAAGINLRSGRRIANRVAIELDSRYERRPNERFYGLGNGPRLDDPPAMLIDPSVDDTAFSTRFLEDLVRNVAIVDVAITEHLHTKTSAALMIRDFGGAPDDDDDEGDDESDNLADNYRTDRLVGFDRGVTNLYVEQQLVYDSRRPTSAYQSRAVDATGWLASAHVGITRGLGDDPSRFFTYGGELQRYFDLYRGSRVLALRLLVESVGGTDGRTDGKIAFIDLPRLGGAEFLRGYPNGRFRDRAVTLATAEYTWDLGNLLAAYTFVDVGRAWRSLADVSADHLRLGFGAGVQIHTNTSFLVRSQIAASRDGDVFLELVLSPALGRRERAGRY